jgi:pimeloyl-ACP methyl ester carboxylesterase
MPVLKSFAGGGVFGAAWGSGPPSVLALHGWRRTHQDFSPVFDHPDFVVGHAAVGLDLFGFGATPAPPAAWGTEDYARHLLPLFDGPDGLADRVTLVGHSFGGRVAVRLARLIPTRIERLVLTGVPLLDRQGRRTSVALTYRVGRRLYRMGVVGDARMEAMRTRNGSPDYRAARGVMREVFVRILAEEYAEALALLTCPVDLVWGEEDAEVPVEVAERARLLVVSGSLRVVPGIGHLVPTEAPDALRNVVLGRTDVGSGGTDR